MISRREFIQVAAATAAIVAPRLGARFRAAALTQDRTLAFRAAGNVTLLHVTDVHAQLDAGVFPRAVGQSRRRRGQGAVPHIAGKDYLARFGIAPGKPAAYALTSEDFAALAQSYGRIGGLDRLATAVEGGARRTRRQAGCCSTAATPGKARLRANRTRGAGRGRLRQAAAGPDAMTGHWEFTYGEARFVAADRQPRIPVPRAERA